MNRMIDTWLRKGKGHSQVDNGCRMLPSLRNQWTRNSIQSENCSIRLEIRIFENFNPRGIQHKPLNKNKFAQSDFKTVALTQNPNGNLPCKVLKRKKSTKITLISSKFYVSLNWIIIIIFVRICLNISLPNSFTLCTGKLKFCTHIYVKNSSGMFLFDYGIFKIFA